MIDVAQNTFAKKKLNTVRKKSGSSYCNKWMNGSFFQAKKNFIKNKKEFLRSPDNLDRRRKFLNAKKKCKKIHYLTEKAFILEKKNLYKVSELAKEEHKVFWSSVKSLLGDTFNKEQNSIHLTKNKTVCI